MEHKTINNHLHFFEYKSHMSSEFFLNNKMFSSSWKSLRSSFGGRNPQHRNRRRRRSSIIVQTYWTCFKSYFSTTLLHGYRYVTETGRSLTERLLFLMVLLGSIAGISYVITDYYLRFINAPTATSQQANRVPITEIPFPAVIVCPATRLNRTALTELASEM